MCAGRFLHKMLSSVIHQKRLETLKLFVNSVLSNKQLSLTELGRDISVDIKERSGIRRADRFLGNRHFQAEKALIEQHYVKAVLGNQTRPDIIVDWSGVPNTKLHILRASVVATGRAITLYEEIHPEQAQHTIKAHKDFLTALRRMLPRCCCPIFITDGGFHNSWFRAVEDFGWDYLGRIRVGHGKKYQAGEDVTWHPSSSFVKKASATPSYFGRVRLCKRGTLETETYLYKGPNKARKTLNKYGAKRLGGNSGKYRSGAQEPWVLATSLAGKSYLAAKRVIKKYQTRMQIEEGFRDLKSTRTGFSFRNAYSQDKERIGVLLLIAMLASFIAWLVGWVAEKQNLHHDFQSNSERGRRVLSLFFLGCRIIKKKIIVPLELLSQALAEGVQNAK